jgi:uncharacterized protein YecT (DUF1311 family)
MTRLILTMTAMLATSAVAQESLCNNPQTTFEMTDCVRKTVEASEQEPQSALAAAIEPAKSWDATTEPGTPSAVEALMAEQTAWQSYVEAKCDYATIFDYDGSMREMDQLACKQDEIEARTIALRAMAG